MNLDNLHTVFDKYVKQFNYMNNPEHREYYKLQVANKFATLFDEALSSDDASFPAKLKEIRKITENLIDSYTTPFYGLCKIAEKEPQSVKKLFLDLFSYKKASVAEKQKGLESFVTRSNELTQKYYPGSYMYTNDLHSASSFLFFYDPDDNYLFKSSHCKEFSDCIGFPEDWGNKGSFDLSAFYRMCDQVVKEIRQYLSLLKTNRSLHGGEYGEPLYPDNEFHILLFDIIYCCSTYKLLEGIQHAKRTSGNRIGASCVKPNESSIEEEVAKEQEFVKEAEDFTSLSDTEKAAVIKQRIGQSLFREKLIRRDKKCRICGLENKTLLRASHIKAWGDCEDGTERLDVNNGLLLCPIHDAIFDNHLISFNDDGSILVNQTISENDRALLNLEDAYRLQMNDKMKAYMKEHRTIFDAKNTE